MDPFLFWASVVLFFIALIVYGIISSKLRDRNIRRLRRKAMPVVSESVRAGVKYDVYLSSGVKFLGVRIEGLTDAPLGQFVDFPLESWLVLVRQDGKRVLLKPGSVRYFEEV